MTDRSYIQMMSSLPDNNLGLIGPVDMRAMVDRDRTSNVNEAFLYTTDTTGVAYDMSGWENTTPAPTASAWMWVRSRALASTGTGAAKFSHVDGLLNVTTSSLGNGYTYDQTAATGATRVFSLNASLVGAVSVQGTMAGALTFYRAASTEGFVTDHQVASFEFDTGIGDVKPVNCSGSTVILMNPGDTLFYRLEVSGPSQFGQSLAASLNLYSLKVDLVGLSVWQPASDASEQEVPAGYARDDFLDYQAVATNSVGLVGFSTDGSVRYFPSASHPVGIAAGQLLVETDTANVLEYIGPTLGWTKPWNVPWGQVAYVQITASPPTFTTVTDLVSVSFTAVQHRAYKFTGSVYNFTGSVSGDVIAAIVRITGSTYLSQQYVEVFNGGVAGGVTVIEPYYVQTGTTGSLSVSMAAGLVIGTGNITANAASVGPIYILVEDIGPVGPPNFS
jgi:hypothetical protein